MVSVLVIKRGLTGDGIEVQKKLVDIEPGMTARRAVEVSGIVSSDVPFYVNASTERHVDYRPAADFAGETLEIYSGQIYGGGGGVYISVYDVVAGFVALKMIGPFVEAFASKLGERLGESVATAA